MSAVPTVVMGVAGRVGTLSGRGVGRVSPPFATFPFALALVWDMLPLVIAGFPLAFAPLLFGCYLVASAPGLCVSVSSSVADKVVSVVVLSVVLCSGVETSTPVVGIVTPSAVLFFRGVLGLPEPAGLVVLLKSLAHKVEYVCARHFVLNFFTCKVVVLFISPPS